MLKENPDALPHKYRVRYFLKQRMEYNTLFERELIELIMESRSYYERTKKGSRDYSILTAPYEALFKKYNGFFPGGFITEAHNRSSGSVTNINSYFWHASKFLEAKFTDTHSEIKPETFEESALGFDHVKICFRQKKCSADLTAIQIFITQHAMERISERSGKTYFDFTASMSECLNDMMLGRNIIDKLSLFYVKNTAVVPVRFFAIPALGGLMFFESRCLIEESDTAFSQGLRISFPPFRYTNYENQSAAIYDQDYSHTSHQVTLRFVLVDTCVTFINANTLLGKKKEYYDKFCDFFHIVKKLTLDAADPLITEGLAASSLKQLKLAYSDGFFTDTGDHKLFSLHKYF